MDTHPPIILITGATDGIGLALARHYAASGARLVLIGRRPLTVVSDSLFTPHNYCQVDLSQADCAIKVSFWLHENNINHLNYAIHNAAMGYIGSLADQSSDNIRQLVAVNLLAPLRLTHALFPLLAAAAGKLVYISSVASALPSPNYAVYSATKAALDGFVRNFQIELMATRSPVTAQVIHLGATRTGIHAKSGATRATMDWDKFPAAATVAAQIAQAIKRRQRAATVGRLNGIIRFTGRSFPAILDKLFIISTRKSAISSPYTPHSGKPTPHCVITGAADGIGRALALTFASDGYTITGIDLDQRKAEETLAELQSSDSRATFVTGNLTVPAEIEQMAVALTERPPIDLLIHNAGINAVGPFIGSEIEAQIKVIAVNFTAPLLLTAALLQKGQWRWHNSMVVIASLSHYVSYPGAAVYAASKDGLASFARNLRIVIKANGGQVLTVYPGPTRTAHARRYSPDNRNEQRRMAPEQLAQQVQQALRRGQGTLIPGFGNRIFAVFGHWLPNVAERLMRRLIFDKIGSKPGQQ